MDLSSLTSKDLSRLPKNLLGILQSKDLSMPQKMMAFNMFIPNLPAPPEHDKAYDEFLEIGRTIKRLMKGGKIRLDGLDRDFKLKITEL